MPPALWPVCLVRPTGLALLVALFPLAALADYIRDEVRIHLRSGPSSEYVSLQLVRSGDEVTKLDAKDGWARVRSGAGRVGWLPARYLTEGEPASVRLPRFESDLRDARARIEELEAEVGVNATAGEELDQLRARMSELESENSRLREGSGSLLLMSGAAIALVGIAIGLIFSQARSHSPRRLKL